MVRPEPDCGRAEFRSFIDPLVVLLTVPLGFIGVVVVLLLTGTNLSIMAFMGIIMMVGIVVESGLQRPILDIIVNTGDVHAWKRKSMIVTTS